MINGEDNSPKGYNDQEKLDVKNEETPKFMVDRLLGKTGPAESTIRSYCDNENLDPEGPEYNLLALSGAFVSAMGRRAQRKFLESDPKELIHHEWGSALKAHNFMGEVIDKLELIDEVFTKRVEVVKPGWKEVKPYVVAKLEDLEIENLDEKESKDTARSQILLEKYRSLERNTRKMSMMIYLACKKYGVEAKRVKSITDKIMSEHYPEMPEYIPDTVGKDAPLAYETNELVFWESLIDLLD